MRPIRRTKHWLAYRFKNGQTAYIERCDLPLWRNSYRRWRLHPRGLIDSRTNELFHRVALGCARGDAVEFRDGNALNCRRSNMTKTTMQAMRVKGAHKSGADPRRHNRGQRGFYMVADEKKGRIYRNWVGRIMIDGKVFFKRFSIARYGNDEAKRLASEWRYQTGKAHGARVARHQWPVEKRSPRFEPTIDDLYGGRSDMENVGVGIEELRQISHVYAEDAA